MTHDTDRKDEGLREAFRYGPGMCGKCGRTAHPGSCAEQTNPFLANSPDTSGEGELREIAKAICKSRTCEGVNCCQWPAQMGRTKCPVKDGGYDDAARAALATMSRLRSPRQTEVNAKLLAENERLKSLINTPELNDFWEGAKVEAVHQRERWGDAHDKHKHVHDWVTVLVHLTGKAAKAFWDGNRDKLKHHIITVAAVAANWHAREVENEAIAATDAPSVQVTK